MAVRTVSYYYQSNAQKSRFCLWHRANYRMLDEGRERKRERKGREKKTGIKKTKEKMNGLDLF